MLQFFKDLINRCNSMSTMRFIIIFTYLFVIIITFITWASISVAKTAMQDIPVGLLGLVSAVIAIVTTGGVFNKREETKQNGNEKG
jgi:1,4-dihydroxy-2-naphthoate octaprenyltransferase